MNYAINVNHHTTQGRLGPVEANQKKTLLQLTFVKLGDGGLTLHLVLLFSILFEFIVNLDMIPSIELEGVVLLAQKTRAKLEGVASLLVVLGIMGAMGRLLACLLGSVRYLKRREVRGELCLPIVGAGDGDDCFVDSHGRVKSV